ncbi:uncharacterized protein LOC129987677 [Argiope bruennichi]|uniref:uncharacterized protein LOC129987677 n=1 Tax=Argiope bruennichi TaxID=94029 RepID=UPI002494E42E|nr:uncharacterized protein LOC129987677 [Argiope bruennichi]
MFVNFVQSRARVSTLKNLTIYLELLSSLSTENFILVLRHFIARRGRSSVIYSDNGTNFVGTSRLFHCINWQQVEEGKKKEIISKFIPHSAPWWGGWWERLIALVKDLLKKVLGRACLSYEELNTILCDCEDIVNSRPITYASEHDDLEPITPSSFLRERRNDGIPDLDHLELSSEYFPKRRLYWCKLQEDLRNRFRLEYLGQLRQQTKKMIKTHDFKVGEVVIVEVTNQKRLNWPLGKITEIFPGKDGSVRLVKIKTKNGEFLRPVQRLYALEVQTPSVENLLEKRASEIEEEKEETVQQQYVEHPEKLPESDKTSLPNLNIMKTRFGRNIQAPKRLDL